MIYHYGSVPMNNNHRLEPLPVNQADYSTAWSALQPTDLNSKLAGRPVAYHENGSHDAGQHALDVNGTNQSFFNLQTTAPPVTEYPAHSEPLQAQASSMSRILLHLTSTALILYIGYWESKGCKDLDFTNIDADMSDLEHHGYQDDGETPTILNLRQYTNLASESDQSGYSTDDTRRQSSSSFALSSNGALADLPPFDDFPSSETASYTHDAPSWNTHNQDHTNHLLSPLVSPRRSHDISRSNSRTRASPNIRSSPYSLDSTRNKRWSTGMYTPTSTPFGARNISQTQDRFSMYPQQRPTTQHSYTQQSVPTYLYKAPMTFSPYTPQAQNVLYSQSRPPAQPAYPTYFPSPEQQYQLHVPRPVPSQGAFRLLQSNVDRLPGCASHFADLSDPPDLYSSLTDPPCDPPSPDMHPTDPDLTPHEQELRFGGDLYTPRFVRGHGNKREGWCGLCKPGRWLVLKNSAFWYDKLFTHGVNAATGAKFQEPGQVRRMESNPDVWEGLCGGCGEWVSLVSSKKKGTTWFRHAYKVHLTY